MKRSARDKGNVQSNYKKALYKELQKIKSGVNTKKISLELDDGVLDIHTLKNVGVSGASLVSNGEGGIEWNKSISAKQRDVFLIQEDVVYNFSNTEETELIFPLYRNGCFSLEENDIIMAIDIRIYYKYINSSSHLPFDLFVKKNNEIVYQENFGDYDDYTKNQKLNENIIITANNTDTIQIFIKKRFNDVGDFVLLRNSFITYEVL